MFCSYCGSRLDDDAVVCPNCRAKVITAPKQEVPPVDHVYEQPVQYKDVADQKVCNCCGSRLEDDAVICPNCHAKLGTATKKVGTPPTPAYEQPAPAKENTVAIIGFVFSFFAAIVGLICSIIGFRKAKNEGAPYRNLALAGIIISILSIVGYIIIFTVGPLLLAFILSLFPSGGDGVDYGPAFSLLAMFL